MGLSKIFSKNSILKVFLVLWLVSFVLMLLITLHTRGLLILSWIHISIPVHIAKEGKQGEKIFIVPLEINRLEGMNQYGVSLQLFEGVRMLGPSNAQRTDIGKLGGGMFLYENNHLFFSTSDNSDPRTNGRLYTLMLPMFINPKWMFIALVCVILLSLLILLLIKQNNLLHGREFVFMVMVFVVIVVILGGYGVFYSQFRAVYSLLRTQLYVISFNPVYYENQGSDYCNPRFYPELNSKPKYIFEENIEYYFNRLSLTRAFLWGIDRPVALKHIFETITKEAKTDTERHLAILRFLQRSSYHTNQIIDASGSPLRDPLIYLELSEMACGDVARVAVDLFAAAGYKGRIVQLSSHQIAEIFYDNDWHYFDANIFSGGAVLSMADGSIPSVVELSRSEDRIKLDSLPNYYKSNIRNSCLKSVDVESGISGASYAYFSLLSYQQSGAIPVYYVKKKPNYLEREKSDDLYYGWNIYDVIPDTERVLTPLTLHSSPSIVIIESIRWDTKERLFHLTFYAKDADNDFLGYRVYISNQSRGWDYPIFYGEEDAKFYWTDLGGWKPEMYDAYHRLPLVDVALMVTQSGKLDIHLPNDEIYFLSIMAYDAYGEKVGRELYPASNEIRISWEN